MDRFSSDYFAARQSFREAAGRLGWELESHAVEARGPAGEELTMDVARSPSDGHGLGSTFVVSSGLHGVEGFFGSAVQLGLMEQWLIDPASIGSLKVVLVHALNPYGFAWLRRCNEDNVDLNRNFLLSGQPFTGCPEGYAKLDGLLNPHGPSSTWDFFVMQALWAVIRNGGVSQLRQAVAGGQYDYPKGLFYGGARPTQTQRILAEHWPRWMGGSRRVVHLDLHTGLGKWGGCKLLIDHAISEAQEQRLDRIGGSIPWEKSQADGIAYQARGSLGQWCVERMPGLDYLYACAEFGTYGNLRVAAALRVENQAHHWGKPEEANTMKAKQRLKEVFCPEDEGWRREVLDSARKLVERAVADLTQESKLAVK